MMIIDNSFILILKIYVTLSILVMHIVLSIILMVLMIMEFTKGVLARLKMFYKENMQKSRRVFIMQGLRRWKLDFKSFSRIYYMSNFRRWNDDHLKFAVIFSLKSRLGFLGVELFVKWAFAYGFLCSLFFVTLSLYYFILSLFYLSS